MQKIAQRKSDTVFGDKPIMFFGYNRFSAAMNMAIDEAMMQRARETGNFYFRAYDFTKPTAILALSDHPDNIDWEHKDGFEVTRRVTGGTPICINDSLLSYSVAGPAHKDDLFFADAQRVHNSLGGIIVKSVQDIIGTDVSVELGEVFSIKVNGKRIAGHGQYISPDHSFLYHGVLAVVPRDPDFINSMLTRKQQSQEFDILSGVKSFIYDDKSVQAYKKELVERILSNMPKENVRDISLERDEILKAALKLYNGKYNTEEWVMEPKPYMKRDRGDCMMYPD